MKEKMANLCIKIDGGLGNQLFMLYAGIYISQNIQRNVIYDVSKIISNSFIHKGMNILDLGLLDYRKCKKGLRVIDKFRSVSNNIFKSESVKKVHEIGFVKLDYASLIKVTRVEGYFQTWKYFDAIKEKPIPDISKLPSPTEWFKSYEKTIKAENCVAIHVRRGDYLLAKNIKNGMLSTNYYKSILENFSESKKFLVFTDSPEIVKPEFSSIAKKIEIMKPPHDSDPFESMLLMSYAKNIIIANSTFSWWAGKIARSESRVIAPKKWFKFGSNPKNLYPKNWEVHNSQWI